MATGQSRSLKASIVPGKNQRRATPTRRRSRRSVIEEDIVMTNRELAKYLKTTVEQLCRLRRAGKGPAFGQVGHLIRYRKSVVDAWLASRTLMAVD